MKNITHTLSMHNSYVLCVKSSLWSTFHGRYFYEFAFAATQEPNLGAFFLIFPYVDDLRFLL